MGKPTDPLEVHAVAGKIITFLAEDTAVSLEVQSAALDVASETLRQTIVVNNSNDFKNEARNFWRKK